MANILTECYGESILQYFRQNPSDGVDVKERESGHDFPLLTQAANLISRLQKRPGHSDSGLASLKQLFLHHLLQLRCNTHNISTIIVDDSTSSSSEVQSTSEVQLGSAVYPTASLMNHSCNPNALFRLLIEPHDNGCIMDDGEILTVDLQVHWH